MLVGLALLAFVIAGCGSNSRSTTAAQQTEPPSPIVQSKLSAEAKATDERERHEEQHEQVEEERTSAREAAQQRREQKQRETRERSEREAEENSPESHHYPPAVRAGFIRGCEHSTGHEDSACECAIKRIEAKVPLGRYRENEREVAAGRQLPLAYSIQYGYCVGKETTEGTG